MSMVHTESQPADAYQSKGSSSKDLISLFKDINSVLSNSQSICIEASDDVRVNKVCNLYLQIPKSAQILHKCFYKAESKDD